MSSAAAGLLACGANEPLCTNADANKQMLVRCDVLIPTLLDAVFLDPEHPRKDMDEALRAGIQRDGAECLLQLALVEPGKELLERHPEALEALRALAGGAALNQETRLAASGALVAVEGPPQRQAPAPGGEKHIVVSCTSRTQYPVVSQCAELVCVCRSL